jgi:hypothetical protein
VRVGLACSRVALEHLERGDDDLEHRNRGKIWGSRACVDCHGTTVGGGKMSVYIR